MEGFWKQISVSSVLDEPWVSQIPVLMKPLDLISAPISRRLLSLSLFDVKVDDSGYLERQGKAVSIKNKLERIVCSSITNYQYLVGCCVTLF